MKNATRGRPRDPGKRNEARRQTRTAGAAISTDPPVAWRFETRRMARAYSREDEKRLKKGGKVERRHARELRRCRQRISEPCDRASCRVCARKFRRKVLMQLVQLADADAVVVTLFLNDYAPGDLGNADVDRMRDGLRTRCDRAGLRRALIAGGIEAEWKSAESTWRLHAHLAVIGGVMVLGTMPCSLRFSAKGLCRKFRSDQHFVGNGFGYKADGRVASERRRYECDGG